MKSVEYKSLCISDLASTRESFLATSDGIESSRAMGKATEFPPQDLTGGRMPTDFKELVIMDGLLRTVQ